MQKFLCKLFMLSVASLFVLNLNSSQAVEYAVGVSAGVALHNLKGEQDILYMPNLNNSYVTVIDKPVNAHFYRALNLSLDYQARYEKFIIGGNISFSNPNYRGYLKEDDFTQKARVKIITNMVDISLEGLYKFLNVKNFNLYGGGAFGFGFMHIAENSTHFVITNSTHNNTVYFIPKLILYGEYNFNKHLAVYSKLNFTPKLLTDDIVYQVNQELVKNEDNKLISNTVTVQNLAVTSINLGILFKF